MNDEDLYSYLMKSLNSVEIQANLMQLLLRESKDATLEKKIDKIYLSTMSLLHTVSTAQVAIQQAGYPKDLKGLRI